MAGVTRALPFAALLVAFVGCDHATKELAVRQLADAGRVSLAVDIVRFELVANTGAFLSLGSQLPGLVRQLLFVWLVPLVLVGVCIWLLRAGPHSPTSLVSLAMVAGGGVANWLDRVLHGGAVTDFVSFGVGPLRTGIFNVADVLIVVGVGLLVLSWKSPETEPEPDA